LNKSRKHHSPPLSLSPHPPSVLGVHLPLLPGHVGLCLGLQQRLLLLRLLLHAAVRLALAQALGVGGVHVLHAVAAALQPAGGRLLHHPGQPGRGERQHVQEHPGEGVGVSNTPVLTPDGVTNVLIGCRLSASGDESGQDAGRHQEGNDQTQPGARKDRRV